ncbi:DNA mismatch repair protein MutT [Streptomyces kanasensis]|uniref:DNA mismatch repair protein MutT n=1 Tax=Streptomyces kanasensis TaxID=936756 RepID=A0A100Y2K2_9ACTN|nr:DNA mismatch repair protein MutT [Streptomyces kanasensis]
MDEAVADAGRAALEFDGARAWLEEARRHPMEPLAAEVWVTDPAFEHVLLVKHRVRGWVPPGGKAEPGETPRTAAARELLEETGLQAELLAEPAAVAVRAYRSDWSATLGLSYAAIVDPQVPLVAEPGQPAAWFGLDEEWQSVFPEDRDRIRAHARRLAAAPAARAR